MCTCVYEFEWFFYAGSVVVEDLLGECAESSVYKVRNSKTNETRVLKCSLAGSSKKVKKMEDEVKRMKELKNSHLVKYYDCFVEGSILYIEMEYCSGGDLGKKISERKESKGGFSGKEIRQILYEAALGIKALHDSDVMRWDMKGLNVMFDSEGHVKMGDFGMSGSVDIPLKQATTNVGRPFEIPFYMFVVIFG
jgi:serine/threonine protein kinase